MAVPQLSFLGDAKSFRKRSEEINPDSRFIFYDNATLHRQVRVTGRDMTRPVGLTPSGQPRLWTVCPAPWVQGGRPSPPERLNATFPWGGGKRPIPYNIVLRTASPGCADYQGTQPYTPWRDNAAPEGIIFFLRVTEKDTFQFPY